MLGHRCLLICKQASATQSVLFQLMRPSWHSHEPGCVRCQCKAFISHTRVCICVIVLDFALSCLVRVLADLQQLQLLDELHIVTLKDASMSSFLSTEQSIRLIARSHEYWHLLQPMSTQCKTRSCSRINRFVSNSTPGMPASGLRQSCVQTRL